MPGLGFVRSELEIKTLTLHVLNYIDMPVSFDELMQMVFVDDAINKNDLDSVIDKALFEGLTTIEISAKERLGTDKLSDLITETIGIAELPCDGKIITNPRHASAIDRAESLIRKAADGFAGGIFADLAVSDIETAINTLAEISGNFAQDAVISEIFSRFCVGK